MRAVSPTMRHLVGRIRGGTKPGGDPMSCLEKVAAYLQKHGVLYTIQHHPPAFTAQAVAASENLPPTLMAKVVIARADGELVMLVLPADCHVDLELLNDALLADKLALVDEPVLAATFLDCEVGTMPPFGNLYNLPVYVAVQLATQERMVFQTGTHTETMAIDYADFERLVQPVVSDFARHIEQLKAPVW
jgi:Ala-tRNA(Pro) deacylase